MQGSRDRIARPGRKRHRPRRVRITPGARTGSRPQARFIAVQSIGLVRSSARSAAGIGYFRPVAQRSEEHTSELQSLMPISYALFCLKKKLDNTNITEKK